MAAFRNIKPVISNRPHCPSGAQMEQALFNLLKNALVPFHSTRRSGTGLGLALAREIAEAHGGRITLGNREGGGLAVTPDLPA